MSAKATPSYLHFDKAHIRGSLNQLPRSPQALSRRKGEQGVLICGPYKSRLCHTVFKTPAIATRSAAIYKMFTYLERRWFVGADMARKFLQMGCTRSRRYANYKSGRKYDKDKDYELSGTGVDKAETPRFL
jgi:hypothetical protein